MRTTSRKRGRRDAIDMASINSDQSTEALTIREFIATNVMAALIEVRITESPAQVAREAVALTDHLLLALVERPFGSEFDAT